MLPLIQYLKYNTHKHKQYHFYKCCCITGFCEMKSNTTQPNRLCYKKIHFHLEMVKEEDIFV